MSSLKESLEILLGRGKSPSKVLLDYKKLLSVSYIGDGELRFNVEDFEELVPLDEDREAVYNEYSPRAVGRYSAWGSRNSILPLNDEGDVLAFEYKCENSNEHTEETV
ncbi:MAG: hypothetical protein ACRC9Y_07315 [Aeromonas veronii]